MKEYKFGFSIIGFMAVLLVMLPNVLYLFIPITNDALSGNSAGFWLWNILENIGRFGLMSTLIIICNKKHNSYKPISIGIIGLCALILYYIFWFRYFVGTADGFTLLGLAVFPTVFFISSAIWIKNYIALGFGVLFGIMHIAITASNFVF